VSTDLGEEVAAMSVAPRIRSRRRLGVALLGIAAATAVVAIAAIGTGVFKTGPKDRIAFPQDSDVWMMNPDGSNLRNLTNNAATDTAVQFSPDGSKIAYWEKAADGSWSIHVMGADGSHVNDSFTAGAPLVAPFEGEEAPQWSPDGRRLAVSLMVGKLSHVEIFDAATGASIQTLSQPDESTDSPAWRPDGKSLVLRLVGFRVQSDPAADLEVSGVWLMIVDLQAKVWVQGDLLQPPGVEPIAIGLPSWSPDGSRVLFDARADAPEYAIATTDAHGRDERVVSAATQLAMSPRYSPDGTQIAFINWLEPHGYLWVMNADGSGARKLSDDQAVTDEIWSPDGRSIAFEGQPTDGHDNNLNVINVATGTVRTLVTHTAAEPRGSFGWAIVP
jgi:Tol biopolymer transport system component